MSSIQDGKKKGAQEVPEEAPDSETISERENDEFDREQIIRLQEDRNEFKDLLLRKQAEFENFRKRTSREKDDVTSRARAEVFRQLLPILDAAEKGLASMEESASDELAESYRQGYELLLKELYGLFEKSGIESVPGPGNSFDPNLHEAVLREESSRHSDGEIIEEYRKGYVYREILLRPSQVKVAVNHSESAASEAPGPARQEYSKGEGEPSPEVDVKA